jgi:hypothetical protein
MKTTKFIGAALALILTGAVSITGSAQVNSDSSSVKTSLPPLQSQGQIEFLTGGIGKDESDAILHEGRSWPLMLKLAQAGFPRAVYISDVQVIIKDASGNTVLETITEGPYLLVKLPPGKYSLDATYESVKLHRDLSIQKGGSKQITLLWPAPKNQVTNNQGQ